MDATDGAVRVGGSSALPRPPSERSADEGPRRLVGVNVLFVVPSLGFGGAERQAFLLARHLMHREGAAVRLVSLGGLGGVADLSHQAGIPCDRFALRHAEAGRLGQLRDVVRFAAYMRRGRAQVVLPYCMFQNVLCGLTWRLGGARLCIWNQRDEGRSRLEPWVEALAVGQIREFISNSHHGAEFLRGTLGVRSERVRVIHNGIELVEPSLTRERWRSTLGVSDDAFVASMVANLHRFKDHRTLVMAWPEVVKRLDDQGRQGHLLLAGKWGDQYDSLVQEVRDRGVASRVHFLGVVADVAGLLGASDLAVFSSVAEGLPNAVLEAMAMGLAVVATDHLGIREAVGPSGLALLARPGDPRDLADKIVMAAVDPALRANLGREGMARVRTEFAIDGMCQSMADLIVEHLRRAP